MLLPILKEFAPLSPLPPASEISELDITLLIPARKSAHSLSHTVSEAHAFLQARYPGRFEIILIPNRLPDEPSDGSEELAENLAKRFTSVRVCRHESPTGKGAAIRTGVHSSKGRFILFTDADLPYDLAFFEQALQKLREGFSLVTGNRRLPDSTFNIPVSLLPIAYKRHRLGLAFNRLVRLFLPVSTSDTQAGIKAFSRELALKAFSNQTCPGFFFDLELFLTAERSGFRHTELPVLLFLNTEKSTVRILKDGFLAGYWILRIIFQNFFGRYGRLRARKPPVLGRFKSAAISERIFLFLRWHLTPYLSIASDLPFEGQILDIGCGHGLFAFAALHSAPGRTILGIDHDQKRIRIASAAAGGESKMRFESRDLSDLPAESFAGVSLIDVMHYLPPGEQGLLLDRVYRLLKPSGIFLMREVDSQPGLISSWNRLYEKLATSIGFTQTQKKDLHFHGRAEWETILRSHRFEVKSRDCSHPLFSDVLFICRRPE